MAVRHSAQMPRARRRLFSSRSSARSSRRLASWALAAGVTITLAGCGKKGPPLAPLQRLPARIEDLTMTRSDNEVQARFTLPIANQDGTQPASLGAVELYAISGKPEDPFGNPITAPDFLKFATLITRVDVEPPPEPEDEPPPTLNPDGTPAPPPPPKPPPPPDPRPAQGEAITLRETITPELMKPWVHPRKRQPEKEVEAVEVPPGSPMWWPKEAEQFARVYVVVGVNQKGQRGGPSGRVSVPLVDPPAAPAAPKLTYDAQTITISWPAAPGARLPIQGGVDLAAVAAEAAKAAAAAVTPAEELVVPEKPAPPPPPSAQLAMTTAPAALPPPVGRPAEGQPADLTALPAPPAAGPPPASPRAPDANQPGGATPGAAGAAQTPGAAPGTPEAAAAPLAVLTSRPIVPMTGLTTYNVYDAKQMADFEAAVAKLNASPVAARAAAAVAAGRAALGQSSPPPAEALVSPAPLNATAIDDQDYVDRRVTFGEERCYVVRAVQQFGAARLESPSSPAVCITPSDTFAPAAPKNLVAVGSEGGVSLIWEANTEADLDGYIVLRGAVGAGGAAPAMLAPITTEPVRDTTYRDTTAKPNVRYVYAVVAVDKTTPRNTSPESNRVEESAR
jgi:hypothetical protein